LKPLPEPEPLAFAPFEKRSEKFPLGDCGCVAVVFESRESPCVGSLVVVGSVFGDSVVVVVVGAGGGGATLATGGGPEDATAITIPITMTAPTARAMTSGRLLLGFGKSKSVALATANGSGP